jgi:hypothetical protein
MLTDEQQRAYDTAINGTLARTEQNIALSRTHTLNAQQKDMLARAEAFAVQAQQARKQDLAAAKSLAERAELLSREVAGQYGNNAR